MKKMAKILVSIVVIFLLIGAGGVFYLYQGTAAGAKVQISGINVADAGDGTYNGKYTSGRWTNEVQVTVQDKKITDIKIIKDVSFAKPEVSKEIMNKVLSAQDTKVDTVTGATITSKAYLKSIENAFGVK